MRSEHILALLSERHDREKWAFFTELSDGTGFSRRRTFDAFAFGLWPSEGHRMIGYEVKVSRADFARELTDPTKRQPMERVSTECFFATPPGLVRVDEVPEGWGLIEAHGDGLKVKKQPTQRPHPTLPLVFLASLMRRSSEGEGAVPAKAWRYEGRDLDETALGELLKAKGSALAEELKDAQSREQAAKDKLRTWTEMIARTHGWAATASPEVFAEAVASTAKLGTRAPMLKTRLSKLGRDAANVLNEVRDLVALLEGAPSEDIAEELRAATRTPEESTMPVEHLIVLDQPGSPVPKQRDNWHIYGSIIVAGDEAANTPRLWVYGRERVAAAPGDGEPHEWGDVEGLSETERDALMFQPWSAATRAELLDQIFATFQPCTAVYQSEGGGETYEKRGREG